MARSDAVGIFPNDAAVECPVGAFMSETDDEWAVSRRYRSPKTLAKVCDAPIVGLPELDA